MEEGRERRREGGGREIKGEGKEGGRRVRRGGGCINVLCCPLHTPTCTCMYSTCTHMYSLSHGPLYILHMYNVQCNNHMYLHRVSQIPLQEQRSWDCHSSSAETLHLS